MWINKQRVADEICGVDVEIVRKIESFRRWYVSNESITTNVIFIGHALLVGSLLNETTEPFALFSTRSIASGNIFMTLTLITRSVWSLDDGSWKRNNIKFARAWHTIWFHVSGTVPFYAMLKFCRHCQNVRAARFNISSLLSQEMAPKRVTFSWN